MSNDDTPLPLPSPGLDPTRHLDPSITVDSQEQALQRLATRTVSCDELPSLIETILSGGKTDVVDRFKGSDVQALIDMMDEALNELDFTSRIRKKCVKLLHNMCARHALFPKSLRVELCDNPDNIVLYHGGYGDVSKREYQGREVAVKRLRIYATSDLQRSIRRFCKEFVSWRALRHPNVLPLLGVMMTETEFSMVSEWMSNGNINQFVAAHQDANRFELLGDVARGLIYMHDQGMIHGDLKGANILVDQTCHARLADFGLLAIISDGSTISSSIQGGTTRWMSPELLDPEIQDYCPTKYSDCYALGMVIWEVLSGHKPFYQFANGVISGKVVRGDRPERPQGAEGVWFVDEVWEVLESCWTTRPESRPRIEDVLQCLGRASRSWKPPSPRLLAAPSTANSLPRGLSDITTVESTDASDTSPSSQLSERLDREEPAGIVNEEALRRPQASQISHGFNTLAWKRLIDHSLSTAERISLITDLFSNSDETETVKCLSGDDAQSFVDMIYEKLDSLTLPLRNKCLRALCEMCGREALLPRSLQIPLCYDRSEVPFYRGEFASVWMGEYQGRKVATKVLTVYSYSARNFDKITKGFCKEVILWKSLRHPNVVPLLGATMSDGRFTMVSELMANGNINHFVYAHRDANRFELLKDAARGLIYIHSEGMIHGDLKGDDILIGQDGHARLASFGLLTVSASTHTTASSSSKSAGTVRWMSPERLDPDGFCFEDCRATKESDCYALGIVILEVLTGRVPFPWFTDLAVVMKVIGSGPPKRPGGAGAVRFTDDLWGMLQQCLSPQPKVRPTAEAILEHLEWDSMAWQPLPPDTDDDFQADSDDG